jgi:esterase/lipase
MNRLLLIFSTLFLLGYMITESKAVEQPKVNEIEQMLMKIKRNTDAASKVTKQAHEANEKMIQEKVKEKAELKQAVAIAEKQVEAMQQVNEIFAAKMIANGMDTALTPMKYSGPIYDAWLNYVEEGGTEEFDYFRMYLWQQK